MQYNNFSKFLTFENYLQLLVLSIPVLLITGPFLPDLFLSLSSLSLIIFFFINKELSFFNNKYFYLFLTFFSILVLSSILSDYKIKSLITSLAYLRFGIFIFVISFLVNKQNNFIRNLYFILIIIFFLLFFDAFFQKLTGSNVFGVENPYGRITSLFGSDIKLGSYIARLAPLLIALSIYLKSERYFVLSIFFIAVVLTLISGERTSFLMVLIFLFSYLTLSNISLKIKVIFFLIPVISLFIAYFNDEIRLRVLTSTSNQINLFNEKPFYKTIKKEDGTLVVLHKDSTKLPRIYHMYFETAIKIFKDNIVLGSGPRTYPMKSMEKKYLTVSNHEGWINYVEEHNKGIIKKLFQIHNKQIDKISKFKMYKDIKENNNLIMEKKYSDWLKAHGVDNINFEERIKNKEWLEGWGFLSQEQRGFSNISGANNHPHNTYLQLLSETGLLGFTFIMTLWIICVVKVFSKINLYYKCILIGLAISLFPFIFTGNFFNNWLSILYFYPLGFLFKKNVGL